LKCMSRTFHKKRRQKGSGAEGVQKKVTRKKKAVLALKTHEKVKDLGWVATSSCPRGRELQKKARETRHQTN